MCCNAVHPLLVVFYQTLVWKYMCIIYCAQCVCVCVHVCVRMRVYVAYVVCVYVCVC